MQLLYLQNTCIQVSTRCRQSWLWYVNHKDYTSQQNHGAIQHQSLKGQHRALLMSSSEFQQQFDGFCIHNDMIGENIHTQVLSIQSVEITSNIWDSKKRVISYK